MTNILKLSAIGGLAALTLSASITTANARPGLVRPLVTGIGFDNIRSAARRRAVRAWQRVARSNFGLPYSWFKRARKRRLSCSYIGRRSKAMRRGSLIGTSGNVNARWTCTATGYPMRLTKPKVKMSFGIGFGRSDAEARGRAIRAWTNAVSRRYGPRYSRFDRAKAKSLRCSRVRSRSRKRSGAIGIDGNPSAPWTCSARGLPTG